MRDIAIRLSSPDGHLTPDDIIPLRDYLVATIGAEAVQADVVLFGEWESAESAPLLTEAFLHRPEGISPIIAGLAATSTWESDRLEDPPRQIGPAVLRVTRLAGDLACLENHAPEMFDDAAREHLRQRLLNDDHAYGVIHELATASYFIRKGATVSPKFLLKASEAEIDVTWNGFKFPVQCKSKPPGAGRVIRGVAARRLIASISRDIGTADESIRVVVNTTGEIDPKHIEILRRAVAAGRGRSGPELIPTGGRTYTVTVEPLNVRLPRTSLDDWMQRHAYEDALAVAEPVRGSDEAIVRVLVGIEGTAAEYPWNSLRGSLDDAARQLKGHGPGVIAIHYEDAMESFEGLRPRESTIRNLRAESDVSADVPLRKGEDRLVVALGMKFYESPDVAVVLITAEPHPSIPAGLQPANTTVYGTIHGKGGIADLWLDEA